HMTATGFYFFPRQAGQRPIFGHSMDTVFCLIFIATFYQTFLVLAYHFIYRYKIVTRGLAGSRAGTWSRGRWKLRGIIIYVLYIAVAVGMCAVALTPTAKTRAIVPAEILEIYGIDLRDERTGFTVLAVKVSY
ncbi:hypothetical protein PFISCL1PPCAC_13868, partial [Pristionchus fissidentatus]